MEERRRGLGSFVLSGLSVSGLESGARSDVLWSSLALCLRIVVRAKHIFLLAFSQPSHMMSGKLFVDFPMYNDAFAVSRIPQRLEECS